MIEVRRSTASIDLELQASREECLAKVRGITNEIRTGYFNAYVEQGTLLAEKVNEAVDYMMVYPAPADPVDHALLLAEVGETGQDAYQVAQFYLGSRAIWKQAAAAMEGPRNAAINAINEATDRSSIEAALNAFQTAMEALNAGT
ncbi:MAG: hypothetical protein ACFB11_00890 [Paracoccaceae bacterium]